LNRLLVAFKKIQEKLKGPNFNPVEVIHFDASSVGALDIGVSLSKDSKMSNRTI
jgi:hypothetical protein